VNPALVMAILYNESYNTGPGNVTAFADGTPPGPQAQSYLNRLHDNWTHAENAVRDN
jgi:hypothetical protein